MNYSESLLNPLPFYATQIVNPFLNSIISVNHDKAIGILTNRESLIIHNVPLV